MSKAVRIWEDNFEVLSKIRSKSERNALCFALISYGFSGKIPQDLKLNKNNLLLFEVLKNNFIAKNQGGAPLGNFNRCSTVEKNNSTDNQPLSENRKQKTESINTSEEDKSSSEVNIAPEGKKESEGKNVQTKNYAFDGKVIRLAQKDFDRWREAFPDLNLRAELMMRDDWLAEQPPEEQKKWYMSTAAYFTKQNEKRKMQNAEYASNQRASNEEECWF